MRRCLDTESCLIKVFKNDDNNTSITRKAIKCQLNDVWIEDPEYGLQDAFYVCDVGDILKKWDRFHRCLPRVKPFYAVKCNPDPIVLEMLASLGANFDCASKGELKKILDMGVSPKRIIYANPCKQASHIKFAVKAQVKLMTFDNESELHKVKKICPNADLVIRILVDDSKSLCKFGIKYGVCPSKTLYLLEVAKTLNLNVVGVSFHVGSGCYDASLFYDAVRSAKRVFDEGEMLGFQFTLLDIGGGFPGVDTEQVSFEEAAEQLNLGFEEFFPNQADIDIIAEPGRYFVASAFTCVLSITSKRAVISDKTQNQAEEGFMYYVNDGVYGSFSCQFFDHHYPKAIPLTMNQGNLYKSSIWGPTCDSLDCITHEAMLPEMNIGEWMYFENMGAYTLASASRFNEFLPPRVTYICDESTWYEIKDSLPSCHRRGLKAPRKRYDSLPCNFDKNVCTLRSSLRLNNGST